MPPKLSRRSYAVTVSGAIPFSISRRELTRWARAGARCLGLPSGTISLAFVTPGVSRELNRRYRRKSRPTNVLSFRYVPPMDGLIGELVFCAQVIRRESVGWPPAERMRFLLHHGLIHLTGRDHATKRERQAWSRLEQRIQHSP